VIDRLASARPGLIGRAAASPPCETRSAATWTRRWRTRPWPVEQTYRKPRGTTTRWRRPDGGRWDGGRLTLWTRCRRSHRRIGVVSTRSARPGDCVRCRAHPAAVRRQGLHLAARDPRGRRRRVAGRPVKLHAPLRPVSNGAISVDGATIGSGATADGVLLGSSTRSSTNGAGRHASRAATEASKSLYAVHGLRRASWSSGQPGTLPHADGRRSRGPVWPWKAP